MLNLEKIKQTGLFKKARWMCQTKKMFMPDQSSLNKLSVGKKIEKRKYNEQRRLQKDTVFQHFTTSFRFLPFFHKVTIKPWDVDKVHKKLKIFEYDDILMRISKNKKRNKKLILKKEIKTRIISKNVKLFILIYALGKDGN